MSKSHGQSNTRHYRAYRGMRTRCENPNAKSYKDYGARGIHVCERWLQYENFLADMGPRPQGTTLEREDNDGNYSPDNCYWATPKQQGLNRRDNRLLTVGELTQPLAAWAATLSTDGGTIRGRLARGWSVEAACTTPLAVGALAGRINVNNKWVTAAGETLLVTDWDKRLGAGRGTVRWRLKLGWTDEAACTTPVAKRRNNHTKR